MTINDLCFEARITSEACGFVITDVNFLEQLMLVVTEIA